MTSQPDPPATDRIAADEDLAEAAQTHPSGYGAADTSATYGTYGSRAPYGSTAAYGRTATDPTLDSEVASDPDLIIVADDVIAADPDGSALDSAGLDRGGLAEDDVDENAVSDGPDLAAAAASGTPHLTGNPETGANLSALGTAGENGQTADPGQQWHDIQALFVDDPRGSVELAAAAADAAVTALVETLHQRRAAFGSAGSASTDPGGTEQLREALRGYRIFCQSLTDIGQRLAQPGAMAQ